MLFPQCEFKYASFAEALISVKAQCSYDYRKRIAAANGIVKYHGEPELDNKLLSLLKQGQLVRPQEG